MVTSEPTPLATKAETAGRIGDKVKIIHTSDLKAWKRFPEYRDHHGPTLGEYRAWRQTAEGILWELRDLVLAQDKLAGPDFNGLLEYVGHELAKLLELTTLDLRDLVLAQDKLALGVNPLVVKIAKLIKQANLASFPLPHPGVRGRRRLGLQPSLRWSPRNTRRSRTAGLDPLRPENDLPHWRLVLAQRAIICRPEPPGRSRRRPQTAAAISRDRGCPLCEASRCPRSPQRRRCPRSGFAVNSAPHSGSSTRFRPSWRTPRAAATSSNVRPSSARTAARPVNFDQRFTATSQ
jgi:hypothetical protein